jgi:hypothetical protein
MDPMSRLTWVVAGILEALALTLAFVLWVGGVFSAPGRFMPGTSGDVNMVLGCEAAAAVICLLVPGWVAHRTRRPAWWLVGLIPALFALGTAFALLADWKSR